MDSPMEKFMSDLLCELEKLKDSEKPYMYANLLRVAKKEVPVVSKPKPISTDIQESNTSLAYRKLFKSPKNSPKGSDGSPTGSEGSPKFNSPKLTSVDATQFKRMGSYKKLSGVLGEEVLANMKNMDQSEFPPLDSATDSVIVNVAI